MDIFSTETEFTSRHIGPSDFEAQEMLKQLGFGTLDEMSTKVIPKAIRTEHKYPVLGAGLSEAETLKLLKGMMSKNQVYRTYIGMGFHDTLTPSPILRNVLESPAWYTAYTPYQPEISQGRLEALLNFQTLIMDMTGMEIANASLLDEGSAAAEAMAMTHALCKNKAVDFIVSPGLHPHVIEVLKTRAEPLGLKMHVVEPEDFKGTQPLFATFVSYPTTDGVIRDYKKLADSVHAGGGLLVADVDLMSLALLTPPGEWGADIVIGNSQRFGVPLGNGGPHAAFMGTKDAYKRLLPGRLVGVSVDAQGKRALRLTLQTREQHIRREKATSNICTAQVLLANMASFYAVYHGPEGVKRIATRIHGLTQVLAAGLTKLGFTAPKGDYFDTLKIETAKADQIFQAAAALKINFRRMGSEGVGVSLNEATTLGDLDDIFKAFNGGQTAGFTAAELSNSVKGLAIGAGFQRQSKYLTHPSFNTYHSEAELTRYIYELQAKDLSLVHSMIPLGSCTMKLNAVTELMPVSWPEVSKIHPFAPVAQMQGYLEMIHDLERKLVDITGFSAVSLQPNSGAQGEYAGLLVIRAYHISRGEEHRNICLIPSSAHGTNPASAVMAGMDVVVVACDDQGNVRVDDLKAKAEQHKERLSCLMITYPSTHGVFEESIIDICKIVHANGGQVYMDGANLNALVGLCRPGDFGPDVAHMNLHKTFAIPHGGGGPGVGPIGVGAHLAPFLPRQTMMPESLSRPHGPATGITATTSAPWGSASILPISWSYITMMGAPGLKKATLTAILSANYIAKRLEKSYPILYKGREGMVAHECILDLRPLKKTSGVDVNDVAKRLMDFGFHAPTMSWPVAGTLMVEPTESESKAELDRFIESMLQIHEEALLIENKKIDPENNPLKNAPHTAQMLMKTEWTMPYTREVAAYPLPWVRRSKYWPPVGRVDNAFGDRNIVCSCPPMDEYQ
ncbi:MAG: aminomethyl-transferring glycine dehydrogenase [Bdellovibrionaceae bacterium]|nr:aminomethyl-transferring glycine dehydrogenase [Pseudobdellovibrionaceae bacterium]